VGREQVTTPKSYKLYDDDDDCCGNFGTRIVADKFSVAILSASRCTSGTSWYVSEQKVRTAVKL